MPDTNRPHHWQVLDGKTGRIILDNVTHGEAMDYCENAEKWPELTGFRYTVQAVRHGADH